VWCYILFIWLMSFRWGISVQFYCCIIHSVNHLKFFDQIIPFISLQYSSWLAQNLHNISNPLYFKYNRTCLIRHSNGPGKCLGLCRMLVYSGFILVNSLFLQYHIWPPHLNHNRDPERDFLSFLNLLWCFILSIQWNLCNLTYGSLLIARSLSSNVYFNVQFVFDAIFWTVFKCRVWHILSSAAEYNNKKNW
jgi:hypothetical protein